MPTKSSSEVHSPGQGNSGSGDGSNEINRLGRISTISEGGQAVQAENNAADEMPQRPPLSHTDYRQFDEQMRQWKEEIESLRLEAVSNERIGPQDLINEISQNFMDLRYDLQTCSSNLGKVINTLAEDIERMEAEYSLGDLRDQRDLEISKREIKNKIFFKKCVDRELEKFKIHMKETLQVLMTRFANTGLPTPQQQDSET